MRRSILSAPRGACRLSVPRGACRLSAPRGACRLSAKVLGLVLVGFIAVASAKALAAGAGSDTGLNNARGNASASDFWRKLKQGQKGYVSNPDSAPEWLISGEYSACMKAGNCTESAVDFSLPVHSLVPPIASPQGKGADWSNILFLLAALALFTTWCGVVLVKAGRDEGRDEADETSLGGRAGR